MTKFPPYSIESLEEVARLIVGGEAPPWLVDYLKTWAPELFREIQVAEGWPTRSVVRRRLLKVADYAKRLGDALQEPAIQRFLEEVHFRPVPYDGNYPALLADLASRAERASHSLVLVTEGKTKSGRGKALRRNSTPKVLCAVLVAEAWRIFRGRGLPPRNQAAAKAAIALWEAANGPAPKSWGDDPLVRWPKHFRIAGGPDAPKIRADIRHYIECLSHDPTSGFKSRAELISAQTPPV